MKGVFLMNYIKKMYNKKIKYFFMISHGLPYSITILIMLFSNSFYINNSLLGNLIYISMLSPLFAALFIIFCFYDKNKKQNYSKRIFDFKRMVLLQTSGS